MALHLSPPNSHSHSRHDVFAHSPDSRWAILPDLPYGGRPHSSTASSAAMAPSHTLSAPTSPVNRPRVTGMVPMNNIQPLHSYRPQAQQTQQSLIHSSLGHQRAPVGVATPGSSLPVLPQQTAQHRATQSVNTHLPLQPAGNRISPPTHAATLLAPLSSSNLATLDHSLDQNQARYRSKSRPRVLSSRIQSGSDTERGGSDSDATVIDHRRAGKASYSQTDLAAFRERFATSPTAGPSTVNAPVNALGANVKASGAGETGSLPAASTGSNSVNNGTTTLTGFRDPETITLPRQRRSPKTPPTRPLPMTTQTAPSGASGSSAIGTISPGKSPRSRSSTSLSSMRMTSTSPKSTYGSLGRSPGSSPRNSSLYLAPLTPLSSSSSLSPLNRARESLQPTGSDADAENDSAESSVTFGTRSRSGIRLRNTGHSASASASGNANGLGLSLEPEVVQERKKGNDLIPRVIERMYQSSSLLYLRILAIVPACWGFMVLVQALITGGIWHDAWPWGADFSKEAIYHLSQASSDDHDAVTTGRIWKRAVRGDLLLSVAWAILTGHFCFRFTTGLTYRWRSYYALLPVLIRLLALQGLCWSATYSTLSYLGPAQPLFAWAVIGVSTGFTYAVIMWLASNVLPDRENFSRSRSRSQSRSPRTSPKRQPIFPVWGEAPLIAPPEPPAHFSRWERLNYKRRWDWEAVNREVGWKVGVLLLLTSAWVFWQIHIGWLVRVELD